MSLEPCLPAPERMWWSEASTHEEGQGFKCLADSERTMVFPREVLNELKWHRGRLEDARITYLHRGAPGDRRTISGSEIVALERSFFTTAESRIPYHRIRLIELDGEALYVDREEVIVEGTP